MAKKKKETPATEDQPKEKKITLRNLVAQLLEGATVAIPGSGRTVEVDADIMIQINDLVAAPLRAMQDARPKESRKYDSIIADPLTFLGDVMVLYTTKTGRKKINIDGTSLSQSILTIGYAINELEKAAASSQAQSVGAAL